MSDEHLYENVYYPKKASTMDSHKPELLRKPPTQSDDIFEMLFTNDKRALQRQENMDNLSTAAEPLEKQASGGHMKAKIIIAIIVAIILLIALIATIVSALGQNLRFSLKPGL